MQSLEALGAAILGGELQHVADIALLVSLDIAGDDNILAICHTINHKSGMDHTTYAHTGAMVNLYAKGVGAENFGGVFDNTEIYHKLADLTKVQ